ncbi:MAG TPA: DUF433 domain-containing protein [Verrucomicrobiae bacterium]|nr:DUF433 domain-containing protein [Verrucomicrobiae bacterium]
MNELLERITVNPEVMTGLPCIRGMRIPVTTILGLMAVGMSEKEILAEYPDLESEDLKSCIAYGSWLAREREVNLQPV